MPRHLLVLMPHTGECFSCAGAVAKHTAVGDQATLVAVCSGAAHLGQAWVNHVACCRRAAAVLGATFEELGLASSGVAQVDWAGKVRVAELIRRLRPDILVTMPREALYEQPHSDHETAHQLAWHGRDLAARQIELPSGLAPHLVNDLYFLGDGSAGDVFIDVTAVTDRVQQAWQELCYGELLGAGHGALPLGVSLKRSVDYQQRVRPGITVEAFRPCRYEEKPLALFPD